MALGTRQLRDASLSKWKAYPGPGETNWIDSYTDADDNLVFLPIDIQEASLGVRPEDFCISLEVTAAPLSDGQTLSWVLTHSDDGLSFADTIPLVRASLTGAAGLGAPPTAFFLAIPITPPLKRYIAIRQTCDAGTDVSTVGSATFSVLF